MPRQTCMQHPHSSSTAQHFKPTGHMRGRGDLGRALACGEQDAHQREHSGHLGLGELLRECEITLLVADMPACAALAVHHL